VLRRITTIRCANLLALVCVIGTLAGLSGCAGNPVLELPCPQPTRARTDDDPAESAYGVGGGSEVQRSTFPKSWTDRVPPCCHYRSNGTGPAQIGRLHAEGCVLRHSAVVAWHLEFRLECIADQHGDSAGHFQSSGTSAYQHKRQRISEAAWTFLGFGLFKAIRRPTTPDAHAFEFADIQGALRNTAIPSPPRWLK
jgi:hypothetical protein